MAPMTAPSLSTTVPETVEPAASAGIVRNIVAIKNSRETPRSLPPSRLKSIPSPLSEAHASEHRTTETTPHQDEDAGRAERRGGVPPRAPLSDRFLPKARMHYGQAGTLRTGPFLP